MGPQGMVASWRPLLGRPLLVNSLLVFAAYAVIGALTLTIGQSAGLASPIWPAAGLAFAVVYEWGWRLAPALVAGSVAANAFTLARQDSLTMQALAVAMAVGIGAAMQAVAGAFLVSRTVGRRAALSSGGQIVVFLLLAGPVASVVNATIATSAQVASGLLSMDQALLLWVTWWAGDAIGVVVFAPIALMLIPAQREVWSGRRIRVAIPALVGSAIFLALFVQTNLQLTRDREDRLASLAQDAASVLERDVTRHQEALEGIASFFEASEQVDLDEFKVYADGVLERFPNLQAVSWNPLVLADDLVAFEEFQRVEQGLAGYVVTQRNDAGELVPVSFRPEYVPVAYIEPLQGNRPALGFDINSNPVRREAIARARLLGAPAATAPIDLVQETGTQKGMLALIPVFDQGVRPESPASQEESLQGFAVGVYRLGDLLADSFEEPSWDAIEVVLIDVTQEDQPQEVAVRPAVAPKTIDLTTDTETASASERLNVYGRTWQVEIIPTSGELATPNRAVPPGIDVLALIVLILLQAFVLLVTGLERTAARQAEHADREANTDELTGLHNRRSFLRNLESVRKRSILEGSSDVLLYIDLDGFKSVNDRGGHEAGDRLLQEVGRALSSGVRSRDTVARIGGDEFALILNNCGIERGRVISQSLVAAVNSVSVDGPEGPMSVGASVGLTAIEPDNHLSIDELLRKADDACYEAKRRGGGVQVASQATAR